MMTFMLFPGVPETDDPGNSLPHPLTYIQFKVTLWQKSVLREILTNIIMRKHLISIFLLLACLSCDSETITFASNQGDIY